MHAIAPDAIREAIHNTAWLQAMVAWFAAAICNIITVDTVYPILFRAIEPQIEGIS
jgi:hypothetical protein